MKIKIVLTALMFLTVSIGYSQQDKTWGDWNWLTGTWQGEGSGQPGQGGGTFTFSKDLDEKIIVRRSHSEYPTTNGRPTMLHDDLMIVYPENSGGLLKAIYFDNEGHTINYSVTVSEKTIVFLSDKIPGAPFFRLTYTLLDDKKVNTRFEMSQDGVKFITYIEGNSSKIN